MKCARCGISLKEGEGIEYLGQVLCEDCYMDALSPTRICDPWAVRAAKTSGVETLNETQKKIISLIDEKGGLSLEELSKALGMRPKDVERELAALRHMEKVRATMKNGKKVFVKW